MKRPRKRSQGGTMDIVLIILGIAIAIFTLTMIILFCLYQSIPDTLVQCFFACCGSEGGFMAVIMVAKKIAEKRNNEESQETDV